MKSINDSKSANMMVNQKMSDFLRCDTLGAKLNMLENNINCIAIQSMNDFLDPHGDPELFRNAADLTFAPRDGNASHTNNLFKSGGDENHSIILSQSGTGKSRLSEIVAMKTRDKGHLLVDTELYRQSKGLFAFEYEYARRVTKGIKGRLPRGMQGKAATLIIEGHHGEFKKRIAKHVVITKDGFTFDREFIKDAVEQLEMSSGIRLNQPQLLELLEGGGLSEDLSKFEWVDTQIRENLADALSMKLVNNTWPTFGLLSDEERAGFYEDLNTAARLSGYSVIH
ncbi:hypothetical protein [Moritella sp. F3]|uniref:hypothetical protein n=1 Tax=Moritella sp. F3 TaxID=2718882 RepID=UPI0018E1D1A7|nr:hypothetical protein [Moritella sp. F3]GIC77191.1 hypothetical protein FMO001_19180 [Moritella sp. F1]GIC82310.1 hypothetical protein FMO003_25910 [Moritella sp. F3]